MNKKKLFQQILHGRGKNVLFVEFIGIVESFGFRLDRINGSHHIFINKEYKQLISIQSDGKDAKPYQVRQFITIIERYSIKMEEQT
ncbi:MAG: type II toxin-antitoxin system HicA family toxin [Clostridiales bacterium]|jgi:predicted RNA binding protein YcfA (HicA-like mRNA interferase family)|nr:type II toxin-antitoxin system HicA family toxin [Clostridiales bacterium]